MKSFRLLICSAVLLVLAFPASAATSEINNFYVLCYHNVLDDPLEDPEKYTVSTEELAQQFSWLKEQGYKVISVDDLIAAKAKRRPLPAKAVMLTFDDGYRSFYTHVFPLLKEFKYPAVLALVGSWLELKPGEKAEYEGHNYTRENFLDVAEIREMSSSGLVEIASHSYNLHHGILANPQGNLLPAAVSRAYDATKKSYENEAEYLSRVRSDLTKNSNFISQLIGKRPRVMVWPYGENNMEGINVARSLGMPITFTLDGGVNLMKDPLWKIHRVIIGSNETIARLSDELAEPSRPSPERVMHVDIDNIYDPNPILQEEHLGKLLDRVKSMKVTTVYLQAFADPDGNGAADSVYFPNRHLPMRADLFSRVSWQLISRAGVKVFAWMPLLAFELPLGNQLANHRVASDANTKSKDSYSRLSPFDPKVRQLIAEIYEDLAKHAIFDGILFHDDATLSDYEDASPWALDYYSREWGLPKSISEIRRNPVFLKKWTSHKTRFLTEFSLELADVVRQFQPQLKTARNLYAEVVLNPDSEEWFAQSLPDFLNNYDYTAVMAMPYMENAEKPLSWLINLVQEVAKQPHALQKAVFELQSIDWRTSKKVDSHELAKQMKLLQLQGALNFGYYPDDFLNDSPSFDLIKPFFSLQVFPFSGK
jgi:biofilm PGA synthesis lipoprotein PgaB